MDKIQSKVPSAKKYNQQLLQLKNELIKAGIKPKDMKRRNLALSKNGQIVIIDDGHFKQIELPMNEKGRLNQGSEEGVSSKPANTPVETEVVLSTQMESNLRKRNPQKKKNRLHNRHQNGRKLM
ncbi:hypothetical protein [Paenibacillus sp. GP183]|uniref:hypothetical protein n=1 Tax=Paenibacillus sp. GP183 TaxID=1882751 RepID=UPI000896B7AC|nr:hypothetical protein [Paenibacillus sp. GP183]SEC69463.1 hypothetical protein SAMN05443246_5022 [Paenibacillus sp. GP183]